MLRTALRSGWVLATAALAAAACGSADQRDASSAKENAPSAGDGGGVTSPTVSSTEPDGTCAAEVTTAQRGEVDIIVVIDTSGSMDFETAQVQKNINHFAQTIGQSGLDYRVILIAAQYKASPIPGFIPAEGICVPPPLAGANCADNPPLFRHAKQKVASSNSLDLILSTYDATWNQWVRPASKKVFIEITDDEAQLPWLGFDQALQAKPGNVFSNGGVRKYIFNSICGWQDGTPVLSGKECNTAVNIGEQYQRLSVATGGTVDSVCKTDYGNVFDKIASGVVKSLGCEFSIPKAQGAPTDPNKVVVRYTKPGSPTSTLVQVTDATKCSTTADSWYYDDNQNPERIIFCPTLCASAGQDMTGKLEVAVGCRAPAPR